MARTIHPACHERAGYKQKDGRKNVSGTRKKGLPLANIKYKERRRYYEALEDGNNGNLKPLADLIIKCLEEYETSV